MAQNRGQAILAIENVAHGPDTSRAHGLAAIAAIAGCVHIGMDGTLHGILLPSNRPLNCPLITGTSVARISSSLPRPLARFCWRGVVGRVPSVLPGAFPGADCGTVLSGAVGNSLSLFKRDWIS